MIPSAQAHDGLNPIRGDRTLDNIIIFFCTGANLLPRHTTLDLTFFRLMAFCTLTYCCLLWLVQVINVTTLSLSWDFFICHNAFWFYIESWLLLVFLCVRLNFTIFFSTGTIHTIQHKNPRSFALM